MKKIYSIIAASIMTLPMVAQEPGDVMVYINPGHGGHDSNDRNVVVYPFTQGDPNGYWESNSNLVKGLALKSLLEERGINVDISRTTNTTDDDLGLSTISELANDSGADIFYSIHSNATGTNNRVNFPILLFRGYDTAPVIPDSKVLAELLFPHLISNEAPVWTQTTVNIRGDWSFYPSWGTSGLGVLRGLEIPGMLSEGSFHDYVPETYRLLNNEFCWLEAWHFLKAIEDYWSFEGSTNGVVAGVLYDERFERNEVYSMFGRDKLLPVSAATVTLYNAEGAKVDEYKTDNLYNGFYLFRNVAPGNYTIKMKADTHNEKEASIVVEANKVTYANVPMTKIRNTPPEVVTNSVSWKEGDEALPCSTPIEFTFNWDMDKDAVEAAFSITPSVDGEFVWSDSNFKMVFKPKKSYAPNTLYKVVLAKTACHAGGTPMADNYEFSFMTNDRQYTQVIGLSPIEGGKMHYSGGAIYVQTDKHILTNPIFDQVTVVDSEGKTVNFNKRTYGYNRNDDNYGWVKLPFASSLKIGENYTANISGKLSDKDGVEIEKDIVVNFTAVDESEAKLNTEMFSGFETADEYAVDTEKSKNYTTATIAKNTTSKLYDAASMKLTYVFDGNDGEIRLNPATENPLTITTLDKCGLHVNGDMSQNEIHIIFIGDYEEVEVEACKLDFFGWRYVSFPLTGLKDNVNYKIAGIKLVNTNKVQSVKGAVDFDNLIKETDGAGVDDIQISSLTVYPNPASEYIIVNGDALVEQIQLFAINGAQIAQTAGNILNVSAIPNGNYIIKIKISGTYVTRKVIVAHE